jgi:hypothetical protein
LQPGQPVRASVHGRFAHLDEAVAGLHVRDDTVVVELKSLAIWVFIDAHPSTLWDDRNRHPHRQCNQAKDGSTSMRQRKIN